MNATTRQVVVVELDGDTVRRLNRIAKQIGLTRGAMLRLWILAQLKKMEVADV